MQNIAAVEAAVRAVKAMMIDGYSGIGFVAKMTDTVCVLNWVVYQT